MSDRPPWLIEDLPEETPRMLRRVPRRWGLLIVLGVLLAVAVFAGARPRVMTGVGTAPGALTLPAQGECLRWDVDVAVPVRVLSADPRSPLPVIPGSLARVGCGRPHQGQVVFSWRQATIDDELAQRVCRAVPDDVGTYETAESSSGWSPIHGDRRSAMVRTGTGAVDYVACVLVEIPYGVPPALFTLTAPMRSGVSAGPRWCLTDRERPIGCDQPHQRERVGIADEPRGAPSCARFSRSLVGAPDAADTFSATGLTIRSGMLPGVFGPTWFCDVSAPAGRRLTGSVVGLGSGPLPLS